jgi:hypothetical protein
LATEGYGDDDGIGKYNSSTNSDDWDASVGQKEENDEDDLLESSSSGKDEELLSNESTDDSDLTVEDLDDELISQQAEGENQTHEDQDDLASSEGEVSASEDDDEELLSEEDSPEDEEFLDEDSGSSEENLSDDDELLEESVAESSRSNLSNLNSSKSITNPVYRNNTAFNASEDSDGDGSDRFQESQEKSKFSTADTGLSRESLTINQAAESNMEKKETNLSSDLISAKAASDTKNSIEQFTNILKNQMSKSVVSSANSEQTVSAFLKSIVEPKINLYLEKHFTDNFEVNFNEYIEKNFDAYLDKNFQDYLKEKIAFFLERNVKKITEEIIQKEIKKIIDSTDAKE